MEESRGIALAKHTGTRLTRFNACKHGVLSKQTVLPWEDENEYGALLAAFVNEHQPAGPTEEHLVEELAGIVWRKRRLRLAEAAAHRQGLRDAMEPYRRTAVAALVHLDGGAASDAIGDAVRATPADCEDDLRDLVEDEAVTDMAVAILQAEGPDAYRKALATLRPDTCEWWEETLTEAVHPDEGGEPYRADAASLLRFIEDELRPWFARTRRELEHRPLLRAQALGQSLDPEKFSNLARYEVHLDRKMERTLSMLIRLKELRAAAESS